MFNHIFFYELRGEHIYRAIKIVVFLLCCNSLYILLRDHIGYPTESFLVLKEDRFADLLKFGISFKTFFLDFDQNIYFQNLKDIFKNYYLHNPYWGIEGLSSNEFHYTHFAVPIYAAISILFTKFLTIGVRPEVIIFLYFATNSIVFLLFFNGLYKNKYILLCLFFLFTFNYPSILVYTRGNLAGLFSLLFLIFSLSIFKGSSKQSVPFYLYCAAMPVRFTSLIFTFLILKTQRINTQKFFIFIIKTILFSSIFLAASFIIMNIFYPAYTLDSVLTSMLRTSNYLKNNFSFHGQDASLFALFKNLGINNALLLNICFLSTFFIVFIVAAYAFYKSSSFTQSAYIITTIYFLVGPISVYYHLTLFILPICTSYFESTKKNIRFITICSSLLLSPWTYKICSINIQPFIVHAIMLYSIAYLFVKSLSIVGNRP